MQIKKSISMLLSILSLLANGCATQHRQQTGRDDQPFTDFAGPASQNLAPDNNSLTPSAKSYTDGDDHHHHDHDHFSSGKHTHSGRSIAHEGDNFDEVHNHPELGVKLNPDSPFCDENENGIIDDFEIKNGPNCRKSASGQAIFAQKPIASYGLKKGELILTTDDGPNPNVSPKVYDLLNSYNIKGTFFLTGNLVPQNTQLVQRLVRDGHTVGNHTYTHNVPKITSETIRSEIMQAHNAIITALNQASDRETLIKKFQTRLLFRAPGLGWNAGKATVLNSNNSDITYKYVGPIHANLGTDAPRADWSCWSKGVGPEQCADWYFHDIINTGRGVILSHDVFYSANSPQRNTYEMLKILLSRLDNEGGGICNKPNHRPDCVWTFKTFLSPEVQDSYKEFIADSSFLESIGHVVDTEASNTSPQVSNTSGLITSFKTVAVVRGTNLKNFSYIDDQVKAQTNTGLSTNDLTSVIDQKQDLRIGTAVFKLVKITGLKPNVNQAYLNSTVYIWEKAF